MKARINAGMEYLISRKFTTVLISLCLLDDFRWQKCSQNPSHTRHFKARQFDDGDRAFLHFNHGRICAGHDCADQLR